MMTTRTSAAFVLLFLTFMLRAQFVFIADTNMRVWLNEKVPDVVDVDGFMDTLVAQTFNETFAELNVDWAPSDLTGLQYLTNLEGLDVGYLSGAQGGAQTIPAWPPNLWYLEVGGYNGDQLLPFPSGVQELHISGCSMLEELPPLPTGVSTLSVLGMPVLGSLPPWPAALNHLSVGGGMPQIATLPEFPSGIASVSVHDLSSLTAIPTLPEGFASLEMSALPMLSALPDLPSSLQVLRMSTGMNVPLDTLPSGLVELQLASQPFAELPTMPATLELLHLYDLQQLQSLPALPSGLSDIRLQGLPQLACVPQVPDTTWLLISATGLTCIPNYPIIPDGYAYIPYAEYWGADHLPLCTILNSSCPNNNSIVSGSAFHDLDADGIRDPGEPPLPPVTIAIEPMGLLLGVQEDGRFSTGVPLGDWTIACSLSSPYVTSISPAMHTASFAAAFEEDSLNDFAVVMEAGIVDMHASGLWYSPSRPGFENDLNLTYRNNGTTNISGTVSLTIDNTQQFTYAYPAPASVAGQTISWSFTDMTIGTSEDIMVRLSTDISVPLGTPLTHVLQVDAGGNEETPADNTAVIPDTVVASYDPNDKQVSPPTMTPQQVQEGDRLMYTVRFQNTGSYLAERVIVVDTLSERLQWSTFEMMSASHAHTWTLDNGVLQVVFNGIDLPDSTSDEPNSHGFVRFSIKPASDLSLGESVSNTAYIYFDFNEPVITNEAVFTVETSTAVAQDDDDGVRLWPNPADEQLFLDGAAGRLIEVLDAAGRIVLRKRVSMDRAMIDVGGLVAGTYSIRVPGWSTKTFIKR